MIDLDQIEKQFKDLSIPDEMIVSWIPLLIKELKSARLVCEAGRKFLDRYTEVFGLHDACMRGELIQNFFDRLKELDGEK